MLRKWPVLIINNLGTVMANVCKGSFRTDCGGLDLENLIQTLASLLKCLQLSQPPGPKETVVADASFPLGVAEHRAMGPLSSQDGGNCKHGSPPLTTTSALQLNYRTTVTKKKSESELSGSPTTTELKKLHPSRLVDVEMLRCRIG